MYHSTLNPLHPSMSSLLVIHFLLQFQPRYFLTREHLEDIFRRLRGCLYPDLGGVGPHT